MILTAWRIVKFKYVDSAFDGEGARLYGGRWNKPGLPVVYAAESRALAVLEILVHLAGADIRLPYALIPARFDAALVSEVTLQNLPVGWRSAAEPEPSRRVGDSWLRSKESAVLRVPSAIVPEESCYLMNPRHPEFARVNVGNLTPFDIDSRLK